MYQSPVYKEKHQKKDYFDWEAYFSSASAQEILDQLNPAQLLFRAREHLKEDRYRLAVTLNKMMRRLLKGKEPHQPRILELGAATGFLTRWFIEQYGGSGVLVDNSQASFKAYSALEDHLKQNITYVKADLFRLELAERFDLVCSFGLIEHFQDKGVVLEVHKKYAAAHGIIVILVPMDTPLTRTFLEIHPEMNLGYRELLKEKECRQILTRFGLNVLGTESSRGYAYDFLGALCT